MINIKLLRCPECFSTLKMVVLPKNKRSLICSSKRHHLFKITNGVPILLSADSIKSLQPQLKSKTGKQMVSRWGRKSKIASLIDALMPKINILMEDSDKYMEEVIKIADSKKIVVAIGSGSFKEGENIINLDISSFNSVDIVGDAHILPFKNGSVDGVLITWVLEHVNNPIKVAEEIVRILKKGGRVYAASPFLFFYHGYPNHFFNFTLSGHNELFKNLKIIKAGSMSGPISTITTLITNIPLVYISNYYLAYSFCYILYFLILPFRLIDLFFKNNPNNFKLTQTVYFYGEKR